MQNLLVSAYGYQWKQRRFGGVFTKEYIAAKERENFTVSEWSNYQQYQLQKIILHAFEHVPFYKEKFLQHGITATVLENISPENIGKLPFLSKEELRIYGNNLLLADVREKSGSFFFSSGSTGTPTQILFSKAMHQRWFALFESRVRNWAGVSSSVSRGMIGGRRIIPDAKASAPFYRYNFF